MSKVVTASTVSPEEEHDLIDGAVLKVEPDHLDEQVNPFPIDVLPRPLPAMVADLHKTLNFPPENTGTAIIASVLGGIGRTLDVFVREGYTTPTNGFFCMVGAPGTNKTWPLTYITTPIRERDAELRRRTNAKLREIDGDGDVALLRMVEEDINIEALYRSLNDNPRGINLIRQELSGWWQSFNQYRPGADREAYLSLFDGTPTSYTRKKAPSYDLPAPGLVVMGTTQQDKVHSLTQVADGLVPRILFSVVADKEAKPYPEQELNPEWAVIWSGIMRPIMDIPMGVDEHGDPEPTIVFMTDAARELWHEYDKAVVRKINREHDIRIKEIFPKLRTYLPRIALAMEVLQRATDGVDLHGIAVSGDAMEKAATLMDYFEHGARHVHHLLYEATPVDGLDPKRREAYAALSDEFTYADAFAAYEVAGMSGKTAQRDLRKRRDLYRKLPSGSYIKLL